MKITRAITRETDAVENGDPVMIEIGPRHLTLWRKGTRQRYSLPYGAIYWRAAKLAGDQLAEQRHLRRLTRGK